MRKNEVYWVIGESTNCGKTTVSCGLIRHLNLVGKGAFGFKPFSAARILERLHQFQPGVDLKSELVGNDGRRLCDASGLSDQYLHDVVNPYYMLFRNNVNEPVLSRVGSKCLKNSSYSRLSFYDVCLKNENIKNALDGFAPLNKANYSSNPVDFEEQAEAAYQLLLAKKPCSHVIEGAGPLLPIWRKKEPQQVNHILAIMKGRIFFCKNVNMYIRNSSAGRPSFKALFGGGKISLQDVKSLPIKKVAQGQVDAATDSLISKLLNSNYSSQ